MSNYVKILLHVYVRTYVCLYCASVLCVRVYDHLLAGKVEVETQQEQFLELPENCSAHIELLCDCRHNAD